MSSITSTYTSSVLDSQRTQPRFQADLKPFNKRSAKSDHAHATPAKARKLSQSETAPQRLSVDTRAKVLASSLKRRHENRFAGKAPTAVMIPAKKSPGKVRFLGRETMQADPVSPRENIRDHAVPSGETVQIVVPTPNPKDGSTYKANEVPKGKIETVITHIKLPRNPNPTPNPDAAFEMRYRKIKSRAWDWAKRFFADVDPEAKRSLDLLRLAHGSPELMEIVNWISCRGRMGTWEDVFNERRALLVYGVLGKVLETHVLTHEMFGADGEQLRELRELDMELVNRDGFYRQRCRAHRIHAYLSTPNAHPPLFTASLTALLASTVQLLSPILPSTEDVQKPLQRDLLAILHKAASLSLSMRRQRDTIYHWETPPAVGSLYEEAEMYVLNQSEYFEEREREREQEHNGAQWRGLSAPVEVVTMAGWPACVAYRASSSSSSSSATNDHHTKTRPNDDGEEKGKKKVKGGNGNINDDKEQKKENKKKKKALNTTRLARAEVCVSLGPAIKPPLPPRPSSSSTPMESEKEKGEDWLGKRLRVEMTERHDRDVAATAKKKKKEEEEEEEEEDGANEEAAVGNAAVTKRVAVAGFCGVAAAALGVGYLVGSGEGDPRGFWDRMS